MTPIAPKNLLRRTTLALAALAAAWIVFPASAANITLGGSSAGEHCVYTGTTVDPSGNVTVMCSAQAAGGLIGTATTPSTSTGTPIAYISGVPAQLPLSSSISPWVPTNVYITLTAAQTSGTTINYNIAGTGCYMNGIQPPGSGAVTIAAGQTQSAGIGLMATSAGTICSLGITSVSPSSNATFNPSTATTQPSYVNIPVSTTLGGGSSPTPTGTTGGGVPTVSGCPTPAAGTTTYVFPASPGQRVDNNGFSNFVLPNGAIGAVKLPNTVNGHSSGQVQLTYSPFTASTQTLVEISISKCPGVIDNTGGTLTGAAPSCYFSSFTSADATVDWMGKLISGVSTVGKCMALESDGIPYYANIRYTYDPSGCLYSSGQGCGEQLQWNDRAP